MSAAASGALSQAARATILRPDLVVPEAGPANPVALAVSTGLGLVGTGAFFAVSLAGLEGGASASSAGALLAVPPLAALLTFPPLYLLTALRGRAPRLLELLAVAASGPTVAGLSLGASVPLVLLYRLTGEVDTAYVLLVLGLLGLGLLAGTRAALKNQRAAGPGSPGALVVLGHYGLTLWTGLMLALHLT